jgi:hypothetical protein
MSLPSSRGVVTTQHSSAAPDAGSVLKFVSPLIRKSKWQIAFAMALAAIVTFALTSFGSVEIWSSRAILKVGLAPASDFIAQRSGSAVTPIELPRRTIARLSDPAFKALVVKRATFETETASTSRSMVAASLRGVTLDGDREISVELSAGSAADVRAAFQAIATEIGTAHREILDRQLQLLQGKIDADKASIADLEQQINELNNRTARSTSRRSEFSRSTTDILLATMISAWTDLQKRANDDATMQQLSEPSVLRIDPDSLVVTRRSIDRLRASLLAGAGMLLAMIILTVVVSPSRRPPASRTTLTDH